MCLLFSFLHPQHEARVRDIAHEELPGCNVSLSSEILPQIREYYRLSTTVINAYLQPILARYVANLDRRLAEAGVATPQKYIMQSNGGTSTFAEAARTAVTTVLSGPAGGVAAGVAASRMTGLPNIITFDMGGTSCDVALIKDGAPIFTSRGKIEGRDLAVPMMDINTVSAGGGTIARADRFGALEVGPQSAGAVPGPACYSRGGVEPAITDCNLVLGYLSADNFLGGRMKLDRAKADAAVARVAKPLSLGVPEAAEGIVRIIEVKMEEAIKAISTMRGHDLRDFMLLAFGGAGPVHAARMARDLGMAGVIVPLYPGVFSALGLLMSDVKHDYIRSRMTPISQLEFCRRRTRCSRNSMRRRAPICIATALPTRTSASNAPSTCATPARATRSACPARPSRSPRSPSCARRSTPSTKASSATARRKSRSRSCPIASAASAWCSRSPCRNSSRRAARSPTR